jgi:hypothetical protein
MKSLQELSLEVIKHNWLLYDTDDITFSIIYNDWLQNHPLKSTRMIQTENKIKELIQNVNLTKIIVLGGNRYYRNEIYNRCDEYRLEYLSRYVDNKRTILITKPNNWSWNYTKL